MKPIKWNGDNFLEAFDSGYEFSESELSELAYENSISTEYGDKLRWVRPVTTIIEFDDRYFQIDWYEGLTEMQPDEFFDQPFEVKKESHEETITVTVTNWIPLEKDKND